MKKFVIVITILANAAILITACKKDSEEDTVEYDTQTTQDNSLAEGTFNDVNNIVNEAIARGDSGLSSYRVGPGENSLLSPPCASVSVTPATPPATGGTVTVNFGSTACKCLDNRFRKGTININYTGHYRDSGTVITTTFNNYFVGKDSSNMFKVSGTKTVTNKGMNLNGNVNFDINVNGQLTNSANVTMNWTSSRNREWIAGYFTQYIWSDDEYNITGSASGTNFEGNSYTANITSALRVKLNCGYITQGVFELTPSGKPTRSLDYGNGTCDAAARITVNGRTFDVTLR